VTCVLASTIETLNEFLPSTAPPHAHPRYHRRAPLRPKLESFLRRVMPLVGHPCARLSADKPLTDRRPIGTNHQTPADSARNPVGFFLRTLDHKPVWPQRITRIPCGHPIPALVHACPHRTALQGIPPGSRVACRASIYVGYR
jgi:hypothetical protein